MLRANGAFQERAPLSRVNKRFRFAIWLSNLALSVQMSLPITIGVFMVRGYEAAGGGVVDEARVGRLTGLLASYFQLAQFFTSYLWGAVSDRVGRKPVLVLGYLAVSTSMFGFGMADNYLAASLSRFIGGLFVAISGTLKCVIAEASADANEQAGVIGYVHLGWGLGGMVGPALGGLLSQPCTTVQGLGAVCAPGGLLETRPYVLPCLASCLLSLLALLSNVAFMPETLQRNNHTRQQQRRGGGVRQALLGDKEQVDGNGVEDDKPRLGAHAEPSRGGWVGVGKCQGVSTEDVEAARPGAEAVEGGGKLQSSGGGGKQTSGLEGSAVEHELPWFKIPSVIIALGGYGCIAFLNSCTEETVPLFAAAPPDLGGLGWTPATLVWPLAFGGLVLVLHAMWGHPRVQRLVGVVKAARLGLLGFIPAALLVPCASLVGSHRTPQQLIMSLGTGLRAVAATSAFTSSMVIVNVLARQAAPLQVGRVIGVGQTLAALARALGPTLGGLLWSLSLQLPVPAHQFLAFALIGVLALGIQLLYMLLHLADA